MGFKAERYPRDWRRIAAAIRQRAGDACECAGQCGDHAGMRCDAPNGARTWRVADEPWRWAPEEEVGRHYPFEMFVDDGPVRVALTVAHVNHDESDNREENLLALCQRCHLKLDAHDNAVRRRVNRAARRAVGELPGLALMPVHRRGSA